VHGNGQVLLSESNDASTQATQPPLAGHDRLELESNPDAEPEHQRTNPLTSRLVGRDGRQLVD
jgi:hypothetical protein